MPHCKERLHKSQPTTLPPCACIRKAHWAIAGAIKNQLTPSTPSRSLVHSWNRGGASGRTSGATSAIAPTSDDQTLEEARCPSGTLDASSQARTCAKINEYFTLATQTILTGITHSKPPHAAIWFVSHSRVQGPARDARFGWAHPPPTFGDERGAARCPADATHVCILRAGAGQLGIKRKNMAESPIVPHSMQQKVRRRPTMPPHRPNPTRRARRDSPKGFPNATGADLDACESIRSIEHNRKFSWGPHLPVISSEKSGQPTSKWSGRPGPGLPSPRAPQ